MDDDTAMAAAVAQPRPRPPCAKGSRRGFFAFLKDGVLVTTRNRGLFLPLAAVHAARSLASLASMAVAARYLGPTLGLEANDADSLASALVDKLLAGRWSLLPAFLVDDVANAVLVLAIQVATACAAVASFSAAAGPGPGRTTLTLASLPGEVRRNLLGAMQTTVFVRVAPLASAVACISVLLVAADALAVGTNDRELAILLLRLTLAPLLFIYYSIPREVAVVVSVAEPGLRARGALRRARRLTRGRKRVAQATLHKMLSWALHKAVWKMSTVAVARLLGLDAALAYELVAFAVVYVLVAAVEVLYTATVTAYYFDCKRSEEEEAAAGHIHME